MELVPMNSSSKVMTAQGKTKLSKGLGDTDILVTKSEIKLGTGG